MNRITAFMAVIAAFDSAALFLGGEPFGGIVLAAASAYLTYQAKCSGH